ncbi:MAG: hypothetical protein JW731_01775 [Bacteroidales bacterium]|nr:hypothetical protein [Bacteroidales bacterium]
MKKFLFFFVLLPLLLTAQEEKKFGIEFGGFVKTDIMYDSRQTVNVREGHFLLYPKNEVLDPEGNDINAKPTFHMLSIQTRLQGKITGPDALGAKTSGMIEAEFFGQAINGSEDLNGFRLRHAIVKLDWTNTQLMIGQYWHPMFNTNCYPGTVSFNTGAPFEPFNRSPQIRVTQKFGRLSIAGTVLAQRDFTSTGPNGPSTEYARNAVIPGLNLNIEYNYKNTESKTEFLIGGSLNYLAIQPLMKSDSGYKTDTKVSCLGFSGYLKFANQAITVKLHGYNGGNPTELTMLGGYAVKSVTDPVKGFVEYTPIRNTSFWADIHTNGKQWQFGLFGGYAKNNGSMDNIAGAIYSRGADIDYVYRISPRVIFNAGKFRVAPEVEYTAAAYGTIAEKDVVKDAKVVGNFRFLLGVYFFF